MVEKSKRGYLSEDDCFSLLNRYNLTIIITLLKEVFEFADVKIDWKALAKSSSTGISNAREYQMLWRHLAYCEPLFENSVEIEPMEDDSDLEFELEAVPPVTAEALLQATKCIEAIMPSGMTPKAHLSGVHISKTSHSKEESLMPDYSETLRPNKRKRHPWTAEEDNDLIAAVKKHGEGNWVNILKEDFKYDRTPSQLSQRWNIIKKRLTSSSLAGDDKINSWVMHNEQLATRNAISMALNLPMIGSLSKLPSGARADSPLETSKKLQQAASSQKPMRKSSTTNKNNQTSLVAANSLIQAAAVAAGGRVIDPSAAASLLKATNSKNVHHIKSRDIPISKLKHSFDATHTKSSVVPSPQTFLNISSVSEMKSGPSNAGQTADADVGKKL